MNKHLIYTLCMVSLIGNLFAQKPYFQQEVHYKIDVTLNDRAHTLNGSVEMEYINHSPDTLDFMYIHLWGNAYQSRNTAFARQQARVGDTKFYFAKDKDLGGYSGLSFTVAGQAAELTLQKDNPDIGILQLPQPLAPGARITIRTPFKLKIPASFSRLGHIEESYQITQWYPKPAVYDRDGWHPMPYLDMGEFYSEFGSFDVSITLPDNYVVGATGVLQTESERTFLQQKVEESNRLLQSDAPRPTDEEEFPRSSNSLKTIRYTAENVHDFAWFADKRFYVQKSAVTLASGRTVDTWVLFTDFERKLWKDAIGYVNRAVEFYSELVSEYPYPQATAVQSALSAGGGMEYPMITVIGPSGTAKALDIVITHEVGHNWFYGILGSNERDHAWLDEGLNSYYEKRYTRQYYGGNLYNDLLPEVLQGNSEMGLTELAYLFQARRRLDQAPATTADDFARINYFLGAYEKPAIALRYLEQYIGAERFDAAMQAYYQQWQFKHPQPADFQQVLETETQQDLGWLFDGLLYSNARQDYEINGLQKTDTGFRILVKNKGDMAGPFTLDGIVNGEVAYSQWFEGFTGEQVLEFPNDGYERITLDAGRLTLDVNRRNNHIRPNGSTVKRPQLQLVPTPEVDTRNQLFVAPAMGWNNYDKYMLGLMLYNNTLPWKNLDFTLAPMYAFGSRDLVGLGEISYSIYPKTRAIQAVTIGVGGRAFHYNRRASPEYDLKYARLVPAVQVELGKSATSRFFQTLQWRSIWLNQEFPRFSPTFGNYQGNDWSDTFIHELSYTGEGRRSINPYSVFVALEQQSYTDVLGNQNYLKASLEIKHTFHYAPKKGFDFRLFAGGFLTNTRRNGGAIFPGAFNLTSQGFNDYRFDDFYFGRTDNEGGWARQVAIRDGGFKTAIGTGFALGRSNNFILAFNAKADLPSGLPFNLPLKPYFDIGYFDNAMPTGANDTFEDQLLWSAGLELELVKDAIAIYFPLLNSKNIDDRYAERGNYWNRIAFTFDLNRLNPKAFIRKVEF